MRVIVFVLCFVVIFFEIVTDKTVLSEKCPNGTTLYQTKISNADRMKILDIHNEYRRQVARGRVSVQPKASNMLKMSWDKLLEEESQRIANSCEFHKVSVNDSRFLVGNNLFIWTTTGYRPGPYWSSTIAAWFSEHKNYTFGNRDYNNYTQVIWAKTYLIGCGYSYYSTATGINQKMYICSYGPAGNVIGENPYQRGFGCENLCEPKLETTATTVNVEVKYGSN